MNLDENEYGITIIKRLYIDIFIFLHVEETHNEWVEA